MANIVARRASQATAPVELVGIGASAGGLRALQVFFAALPAKTGAAFVVVVHLDPEHASELASILQAATVMPVLQVNDSVALQADTVYVIPPNRTLLLIGSNVATGPFTTPRGQRAPIDLFFRSIADVWGAGIAVVLSGSGSDGAVGVGAIREKGGLVLAHGGPPFKK